MWSERSYLIQPKELISFCNAVNNSDEPRKSIEGLFLLRQSDLKKRPKDLPIVPEEMQQYILKKPIEAKISQIIGYKKGVRIEGRSILEDGYQVAIERGKNDGLRAGMRLGWRGDSDSIIAFVISTEDQSAVILARWLASREERIEPGKVLSTRAK
jgi:hypothetical protein